MLSTLFLLLPIAGGESEVDNLPSISDLLFDEDVRIYNDHVVTLASPFLEGRLPGTRGMEIAKEYVEWWMRDAGLEPAFGTDGFRQPFELAGKLEVTSQEISVGGEAFAAGEDFTAMGLGTSGAVEGDAVFCGYSISGGDDGYESFADGDDLSGKIAIMLRFEPMTEEGKSRFAESGWSAKASFRAKLRAIEKLDPAAVVIVNPPESSDPRAERLMSPSSGGGKALDVPVFMMSIEAGDRLMRAADSEGRSLLDMRRLADAAGGLVPLTKSMKVACELERKPLIAENVGGLLPGKGPLADELVVIGAHLDHLGMGAFGSREGSGKLHPGADDNASGAAAILMLAEAMVDEYAELGDDAAARSILFLAFSAEESGLNGSQHYVENAIRPLEDHAVMINFDMIGRIDNGRLAVSGTETGEGLGELLAPLFEASPLEVVTDMPAQGGSDHLAFQRKEIPALFGILADFHDDYHTSRDTSAKIQRESAVQVVHLFDEVLTKVAMHDGRFPFKAPARRSRIRLGVFPGEEPGPGLHIARVSEDMPAALAGMQDGDRIVRFGEKPIEDLRDLLGELRSATEGDKVKVAVLRGAEEIELVVTLLAR